MDTDTNDLFDTDIYNAEPQDIIQISDDNMVTNTSAMSDGNISSDISNNMNNEANRAIFNNIFRSEYSSPILNDSSTNSEINLTYTEQIKLNCTCFPNLSQMAKDYLAIQSTSVPSEQVFSKAG
ncbi:5820_t:CDS:2 [Gigaspora rosea]|nr:5820_t:CDS:2 [Gigaspora rosea]